MPVVRHCTVIAVALLAYLAAGLTPTVSVAAATQPAQQSVQLTVWNRPIVELRAEIDGSSPAARAARVRQTVAKLPPLAREVRVKTAQVGDIRGVVLISANQLILTLVPADAGQGETLTEVSRRAETRLEQALEARAQQNRPTVLLRAAALAFVGTLMLIAALLALRLVRRRLTPRAIALAESWHRSLLGFDLRPSLIAFTRGVLKALWYALAAGAVYVWLTWVLGLFPYSQPWADQLAGFLLAILSEFAMAAVNAVPGLVRLSLIVFIAILLTKLIRALSRAGGAVAAVTGRIAIAAVWVLAIAFAYPFLPGSGSASFQTVSVLVGVSATIAGGALAAQALSGLTILYSGSLKPGEYVRIGETEGVVRRLGVWSVQIDNINYGELTIPNKLFLDNMVTNYSRIAAGRGHVATATVTIGYDAPWRQVHGLLRLAAERTEGVLPDPAPVVHQRALADFYVEYELLVHFDSAERHIPILSALHAAIQDAFNDYGVQIMSPHFLTQPGYKVVVPREHWHAPPANGPVPPDRDAPAPRD